MAKIKLPSALSEWKVLSLVSDTDEGEIYSLSKKGDEKNKAHLAYYEFAEELYNQDDIEFIKDEVNFVNSVRSLGDITNYINVCMDDHPDKKIMKLYIVTDDSTPLSEKTDEKNFNEDEIVDFGIQMSEILEKLATKNIYHGDINPSNVFVTADGQYKLGGFMDAENFDDSADYLAPEIDRGDPADFTTDIYSIGILMYKMSNNGKLPFENDGTSRNEATEKRLNGDGIPAPANGSQKLKSVIHIACQPENKNRWKNASNIKNALLSIKNGTDAPSEQTDPAAAVIAPENTDFEENIFDRPSKQTTHSVNPASPVIVTAAAVPALLDADKPEFDADTPESNSDTPKSTEDTPESTENTSQADSSISHTATSDTTETAFNVTEDAETVKSSYQEPEIDNRVFDDYKSQTKVFSINQPSGAKEKDYGSFFDDDDDDKPAPKKATLQDVDPFQTIPDDFDNEKTDDKKSGKSKKGLIAAIIVGICIILALLVALGLIAYNNGFFGNNPFGASNDSATVTTTIADSTATTKSTQNASSATTTSDENKFNSNDNSDSASDTYSDSYASSAYYPDAWDYSEQSEAALTSYVTVPVVRGYTFERAKEILEAEGLYIIEGRHRPSDEYDVDLVIAQTPGDGHSVEKGTTVIVDISTGSETRSSDTPKHQSSEDSSSDDSDPFSSCKYNTSYLSQSEVREMSQSELNIAFNEIYARRGRIFTDSSLDSYFRSKSWYTPKYTASEFSQKVVFNDYETKNINLIYNEQVARGYR